MLEQQPSTSTSTSSFDDTCDDPDAQAVSWHETNHVQKRRDTQGMKRLNQYCLLHVLGRGAYGKVRMCLNTEDQQRYAVKILKKAALKKKRIGRFSNALESIKTEIAIWKKLHHKHIVSLYEIIDSKDCPKIYIVNELVEGGPVVEDDV